MLTIEDDRPLKLKRKKKMPWTENYESGSSDQQFNSFQYWRQPIPEISFLELDEVGFYKNEEYLDIDPAFNSFNYWRLPLPEIEFSL